MYLCKSELFEIELFWHLTVSTQKLDWISWIRTVLLNWMAWNRNVFDNWIVYLGLTEWFGIELFKNGFGIK